MLSAAGRRAITEKLHINMADAREESETALNVSIQHVLDRTGLKPSQVPRQSLSWPSYPVVLHMKQHGACAGAHVYAD